MLVRLRDLVKHVAIHQRIISAMIEQQAVLPDLLYVHGPIELLKSSV